MIKDALFGLATGDALGVPVEFNCREDIRRSPIKDMTGYGTHSVPPGTWSDDSSLTFCLAEALTQNGDLDTISRNFQRWFYEDYWTPHGKVFDVGIATRRAIQHLKAGVQPELAGGFSEEDNGNGSLMRILPLLFSIKDKPIGERYQMTKQVSSITHRHIRSVMACFYYLEFARQLLNSKNKFAIYDSLKTSVSEHLHSLAIHSDEIKLYDRLLQGNIQDVPEDQIQSSGYVVHTLEASIWCILTTDNYKDAVLKAVNLGMDTDTTGAVTGGLAGLLYGFDAIPDHWVKQLARRNDIEDLANRLLARFAGIMD